jgi:hypothetical protein
MSFPEYLKERISEDYKSLIIQRLQEIKEESENLKNALNPSIFEANQSFRDTLRVEFAKLQDAIEGQWNTLQEKLQSQLKTAVDEYVASWYHSDVSAFQQQVEILISDVVSNIPAPPKKENADLNALSDLMRKLDHANTQSEILNALLQQISNWVDRAILFIVKGDQASGWAALGLGNDWDTARVRQIRLDLKKENILKRVAETGEAAYGAADAYADNGELFMAVGNRFPKTALAFPVNVRGKIAGIFYADLEEDVADRPDIVNLLFLACRAAGFAIDLLPGKPKQAPAVAKEAPPTAAVSAPAPAPSATVEAPVTTTPAPAAEPVAPPVVEVEEEPPVVEEESEPTVMMKVPAVEVSEEDQKLHDDAKRFARLLVSEIKLYNEAQVSAGREHRDLYERLRDDIERSRRMYMERVPNRIHTSTNYFYEELVRTLANGDPTLLGM